MLDLSVTASWLLGHSDYAHMVYAHGVQDSHAQAALVVRPVWSLDLTNLLAKAIDRKIVSQKRADEFIELLSQPDIAESAATRDADLLTARVLLQRLQAPLVTIDAALRRGAAGLGIQTYGHCGGLIGVDRNESFENEGWGITKSGLGG